MSDLRNKKAREKYLNQKFQMNSGENLIVIEYINAQSIKVKFDDETIIQTNSDRIRDRNVINPNIKNIKKIPEFKGFGYKGTFYIGKGKYDSTYKKFYKLWYSMKKRCYNYEIQKKYQTYIDCSVISEWHNFQNFAKWCEINYVEGFQLDKDILVKRNKIYSPDTCCFVPIEINNFFVKHEEKRGPYPIGVSHYVNKHNVNVYTSQVKILSKIKYLGEFDSIEKAFQAYKKEKERYIKWLALTWKNKISKKVFNILMQYEVEVDD